MAHAIIPAPGRQSQEDHRGLVGNLTKLSGLTLNFVSSSGWLQKSSHFSLPSSGRCAQPDVPSPRPSWGYWATMCNGGTSEALVRSRLHPQGDSVRLWAKKTTHVPYLKISDCTQQANSDPYSHRSHPAPPRHSRVSKPDSWS